MLDNKVNVYEQMFSINKSDRNKINGHKGKVLWFTGLSGSGKSTVANFLEQVLHKRGIKTYILDGDNVRQALCKDLDFSESGRIENIRRVTEVAKLMVDAGIVVITAFISPFANERQIARKKFQDDEFIEIYISTPLEVAEKRDKKGLYKRARHGELLNFTGVDSPYEVPINAEYTIDTSNHTSQKLALELANNLKF
jgi:bifunctional enzyme CysN/CysC